MPYRPPSPDTMLAACQAAGYACTMRQIEGWRWKSPASHRTVPAAFYRALLIGLPLIGEPEEEPEQLLAWLTDCEMKP